MGLVNETGEAVAADDEDLSCPLCRYNLRGLTTPRCPECGYAFEWEELRQRALEHPYLFEHAERRRVRAFFKTLWWGVWPWKFWRDIRPTHEPRPGRLAVYSMLILLLTALAVSSVYVHYATLRTRDIVAQRARYMTWWQTAAKAGARRPFPLQTQAEIDATYPPPTSVRFHREILRRFERRAPLVAVVLAIYLGWPWLTFGSLMIFRISMRRARIRPAHVARCVVYSFDTLAVLSPLLIAAAAAHGLLATPTARWRNLADDYFLDVSRASGQRLLFAAALAVLAIGMVRLAVAYRRYLRFPHAGRVVVASQVMVLIFAVLIVLWVDWYAYFFRW